MNNVEYWTERSLLQEKRSRQQGDKLLSSLKKEYAEAQKAIQQQMAQWYEKYASENNITIAQAKRLLTTAEMRNHNATIDTFIARAKTGDKKYEADLRQRYVASRISRLKALQDQVSIQLELLGKSQDMKTFKLLQEVYKDTFVDSLKASGFHIRFDRLDTEAIETICRNAWSGKSFSQRIWGNNNKLIKEVRSILSQGMIQGKSVEHMSRQLAKRMSVDYHRAECLIRTETAYIREQATADSYTELGIEQYEYLATLDNRTSAVCRSLDKKVFTMKERMIGVNYPPMHPRCRSTTIPYFPEDSILSRGETRAARDENGKTVLVDGSLNYGEWQRAFKDDNLKEQLTLSSLEIIITSVNDTRNWKELEEHFSNKYGIIFDAAVKQLDFEAVKQPLLGVEAMFKEFPETAKDIKKIIVDQSGVMSCAGDRISFNPNYFDCVETLSNACATSSASHWWVAGASPASIGAHETAHALEWVLIQRNPAYICETDRILAWNECSYAKEIISQACKNVKKTAYGKGKVKSELIASISRYAQTTNSETLAEAFADIYANGEQANPLSIEIKRLVIERLNQYKGAIES